MAREAREKSETMEIEHTESAPVKAAEDYKPKIIFTMGRGKTGKSTATRWFAERASQRGRMPIIFDGDRTNATLTSFFEGVIRPRSADSGDIKRAVNDVLEAQFKALKDGNPVSACIDLGGGDLVLMDYSRELDLVSTCLENGIEPIAMHFLGSDIDDLSYMGHIEESGVFSPQKTLIVLNKGTLSSDASAARAFEPIMEHEIFLKALGRKCEWVIMPRLQCMDIINKRAIQFHDVAYGKVTVGDHPTINRAFVTRWLQGMNDAFDKVADWLP